MMPDFTQTGKSEDTTSTTKDNVPVVVFKNVSKQYGQISALTDISLAISGGVTGILGMNGAGKSTLFKIIMGKNKTVRWSDSFVWRRPLEKSISLRSNWFRT